MKNKQIRRAVTAAFVMIGMVISSGSLHAAQNSMKWYLKQRSMVHLIKNHSIADAN